MTSVFEVLSNKEIWQREAQAKATIQNMHQELLDYTKHEEKLSTVRPITQRYFMICQTCFWCASYIGTMDIMILHAMIIRSIPYRSYMMNLIVMSTRQLVELCWNFLDLKHLPFSDLKQIYYKCARKNTKNITRILYTFLCMLHAYYLLVHKRLLSLIVNQHHSKKLKI